MIEVGPLSISHSISLTNDECEQGVPTVLLGVLCLFILPGRPETTDFLTHSERKLAIERMNRGTTGDTGAVVNQSISIGPLLNTFNQLIPVSGHVIAAFLDWRVSLFLTCQRIAAHLGLRYTLLASCTSV